MSHHAAVTRHRRTSGPKNSRALRENHARNATERAWSRENVDGTVPAKRESLWVSGSDSLRAMRAVYPASVVRRLDRTPRRRLRDRRWCWWKVRRAQRTNRCSSCGCALKSTVLNRRVFRQIPRHSRFREDPLRGI